VESDIGLRCPNGHVFQYIQGTKVPVFASEPVDANEYAFEDAALKHDNALRWVFDTFGTDEPSLRKSLVSRLQLSKGMTILVTGAGAGNDLPYLAQSMEGTGVIYAQDISKQMLMAGIDRYGSQSNALGVDIYFSASDATNLPFDDNVFDAAYHFGGLNLFPDIRKGISEMDRVVKPGGRIVISDEGAAPWLKQTELGKMLIENNPLYVYDAPLSLLPETARSVNLSWELCNCFYVIAYTVSDSPLPVNIDIPHIGKRGGSIRTRYFGQLEGIDPALRDRAYAEAERLGISRVEYLESLLKNPVGK
jgi:ubiquinone/menaquinone biosynthesis C-methylase UbiE